MHIPTTIPEALQQVRERVTRACNSAGRDPATVRLLLATKTVLPDKIRVAIQAGADLIAENKVQEYTQKAAALADLPVERHFIGHLQTNKIKEVIRYVSCIQSIDRQGVVSASHKRLKTEGGKMDIFLQVNTSQESSKFGLDPEAVAGFYEQVSQYDTLRVKGLMTIGLFDTDPERVRPCFHLLRTIRDKLSSTLPVATPLELSMGMSGDLEIAIAEGATIVRVGTAVFGARSYPDHYYWNENKHEI